jgi:hypothetical protein
MTRSNKKTKSNKQQKKECKENNKECKEYKKDDIVSYINSDGTKSKVKIIGVHYDTPPDVYYTIEFEDGKNKQTIYERLTI